MKPQPPSSKFILTGLIAATAGFALAASASAQTVTNPFGTFLHTTDGQFTDGVGVGEWSDVTPSAFISSPGGTAIPTSLGDPLANSLLFAGLGRTSPTADPSLFLLYDFLPRTTFPLPGETFGRVAFPITLGQPGAAEERNIAVLFSLRPNSDDEVAGGVGSFFDIFVDLDLDGLGDVEASTLGIQGAVDFGPSPLSSTPHLLMELDVPLRIQNNFSPPGSTLNPGGNGINPATGLYDPDPAFWGGSGAGDGTAAAGDGSAPPPFSLQSSSTGIFTINPDASITVQPVPEPGSAALLLAGLGFLGARRRRS